MAGVDSGLGDEILGQRVDSVPWNRNCMAMPTRSEMAIIARTMISIGLLFFLGIPASEILSSSGYVLFFATGEGFARSRMGQSRVAPHFEQALSLVSTIT